MSLDCTFQFCSHPAEAVHADISAAHVTWCAIHHCRPVSVEEVLSSWDTVQLTWIRCYSTDKAIKILWLKYTQSYTFFIMVFLI